MTKCRSSARSVAVELEGEAAAKTDATFDISPLVAIWGAESSGRRSWKSGKPVPGRGNRSFEASRSRRNRVAPNPANSLQMGAFEGSGLCGEGIIVVHSQTYSIASE